MAGESPGGSGAAGARRHLPDRLAAAPARRRAGRDRRQGRRQPRSRRIFRRCAPSLARNSPRATTRARGKRFPTMGPLGGLRSGHERRTRAAAARGRRPRERGLQPRQGSQGQRGLPSCARACSPRSRSRGGDYAKAEQHARRIVERFPAKGIGPAAAGRSSRSPAASPPPRSRAIALRWRRRRAPIRRFACTGPMRKPGTPAKGWRFLDQWCRDNPDDARRAPRAGRRPPARRRSRRGACRSTSACCSAIPNDVDVLNNLAQVAIRQGDKAAVEYAERAYKLANNEAAVLDTLGWALVRHGQLDRGIGVLCATRDCAMRRTPKSGTTLRRRWPRQGARRKRGAN